MYQKNMSWIRHSVLLILVAATALTWSRSGWTKAGCEVERGIDPLDILNTGVRHNVWVILDTSGSMRWDFAGNEPWENGYTPPARLDSAKTNLTTVINELVDDNGNPLVNWGFVNYANNTSNNNTCGGGCFSSCFGLSSGREDPPECGDDDNRAAITARLNLTFPTGWTPNGISLDQLSRAITDPPSDYVGNLLPGQKNFFIIVTDGDDTCECANSTCDGVSPAHLRSEFGTPDPTKLVATGDDYRAYNAGLKGRDAYELLNPEPADQENGAKGSAFVIFIGDKKETPNSEDRANHLAWEASGASYGNPGARPAIFAETSEEFLKKLREVLAQIGVPTAEVTLGSPVVGSVYELIPQIPDLEVRDPVTLVRRPIVNGDVIGEMNPPDFSDVRFARRLRADLKNNVLFTTTVETPGFRGHLRATNIFTVSDYGLSTELRIADDRPEEAKLYWDAGEILQERNPWERTILFNLKEDGPDSEPRELLLEEENALYTNADLADYLGVTQDYLLELDPTQNGFASAEDAARAVVKVIRGWRLIIDPVTGFYNANGELNLTDKGADGLPTWKLWDPTNVGATVVQNPPRSPDVDPPGFHAEEYGINFPDGFYWDHVNRQTVVYLGTNGGTFHAFRADNGAELYAYIPADALGDYETDETPDSRYTLKDFVALIVAENNGIANHQFFIANSASVEDVFLNAPAGDDAWHTVVAFGRGLGGKFITALDVTTVGDWDGDINNIDDRVIPADANRLPKLLFNIGNRDGMEDFDGAGGSYDGLGETWSVPVMGNVQAPAPLEDQWVLFAGGGYGCRENNEGQYFYVLKMEDGTVYKSFLAPNDPGAPIDHNGLVATPTLYNPHLDDPDTLDERDYTTRVFIGDLQGRVHKLDCAHPDKDAWTFNVFYEFERNQPITAQAALKKPRGSQVVWVFVGTGGDSRVDADATTFVAAALADTAPEGANDPGALLWDEAQALKSGERVHVAPVVGGDTVFVAGTSSEFDVDLCFRRFSSTLYAFQVIDGLSAFDLDTTTGTTDNPLDLGEGKVTGLYFRDEHLYVSLSGSIGLQGETLIMGKEEWEPPEPLSGALIQVLVRGFRLSPF